MLKGNFLTRNAALLVIGALCGIVILGSMLMTRQTSNHFEDQMFRHEFAMRLAFDDHAQGVTRYFKCVETADAQETTGQDGVREVPIDVSIANPEVRAFVQAFVDEYNETMKARIAQSASN